MQSILSICKKRDMDFKDTLHCLASKMLKLTQGQKEMCEWFEDMD